MAKIEEIRERIKKAAEPRSPKYVSPYPPSDCEYLLDLVERAKLLIADEATSCVCIDRTTLNRCNAWLEEVSK